MKVVCINCNEIHEIYRIKEAICQQCKTLMSPFEKDILKALAAKNMKNKISEEGSMGL